MSITHKIKRFFAYTGRWLICLLVGGLMMVPAPALAASSKIYAITCTGSNVTLTNGHLACTASPAVPQIEGIGGTHQPLPTGAGVSTVTVTCASGNPIAPNIGSRATFRCHGGSSPRLSNLHQVQTFNGAPPTPSPNPGLTGPTTTCNATSCDLVAQYINPAINVLSAAFALAAIISIVMAGINYSTSEGDPQKSSSAKNRITNTVVAIFAYALLYGFLQFLIPGGLFQ